MAGAPLARIVVSSLVSAIVAAMEQQKRLHHGDCCSAVVLLLWWFGGVWMPPTTTTTTADRNPAVNPPMFCGLTERPDSSNKTPYKSREEVLLSSIEFMLNMLTMLNMLSCDAEYSEHSDL